MIPPALQTKSGAHRMPRAASAGVERVVGELVVGRAGDRLAAQRGDGLVVEHAAERARGDHVDVGGQRAEAGRSTRRRGARRARACSGRRRRRRARAPPSCSISASRPPTLPRPITATRRPLRSSVPNARSQVDAQRDLAAERGPRARVAGAATASPVTCFVRPGDHLHVGLDGADVLGGQVVAAERLDGVAEVLQHGLAALRREHRLVGAQHDHALAAAEREPGDGGLERHRARQPQDVAHRGAGVVVGPHPAAAERGAARRRVDGDHREQARAAPAADQQRSRVREAPGSRCPRA